MKKAENNSKYDALKAEALLCVSLLFKKLKRLLQWVFPVVFLSCLTACDKGAVEPKTSSPEDVTKARASDNTDGSKHDTYEKLTQGTAGVAYRIQMDLELIETGEPINFDYMVRCSNIDVPGSFHPIVSGETSFKALSTGAAVSIAAPSHYCKRALRREPFNKPGDIFKMPILGWFDDVNDMSMAWGYLTNDAYKSPHAKVRFVDFKVSRASGTEYQEWALKTSQTYKQIGGIPGPFGCMTSNALPSEPAACSNPQRRALNGGKSVIMFNSGKMEPHVIEEPLHYQITTNTGRVYLEVDPEAVRKLYVPNGERYGCLYQENDPKNQPVPDNVKGFATIQWRRFRVRKLRKEITYLDPLCLKDDQKECNIQSVYPRIVVRVVEVKGRGDSAITRILPSPDYRGFSLQKVGLFSFDDFGGMDVRLRHYPTNGYSHIFIDDDHVCKAAGVSAHFFDFKTEKYYRTLYH